MAPLERADIEPLIALAREIWYAHYPAIISTAQVEYMLRQRYDPALLQAELERQDLWWDKLVAWGAMVAFSSYFLVEDGAAMKLDKLYVHPAHQRKGYGAALIARACERGAMRGCKRVTLAVNRRNAIAIAAYLKHGFTVADAVIKDIGGGFVMDDYIMDRPLAVGA
jgi:GNAT superfamily N-acetyltransferase